MTETKFPLWMYRWRIALALCVGSLSGGIVLNVLHAQQGVATAVAAGVSGGLFYGLRK